MRRLVRLGVALVPGRQTGIGPKLRGIGWRGLDTRELFFDDVWIADDHFVGNPDLGLNQFLRTLEVSRISIAALSLNLTQAVLDMATDCAKQRVQFGRPISKFQAVQFKLADIATELGIELQTPSAGPGTGLQAGSAKGSGTRSWASRLAWPSSRGFSTGVAVESAGL